MTTVTYRVWTPRSGNVQARKYVTNVAEVIGLDYDSYGSGSVRSASLNGEGISNAEALRLLATKIWVGADDDSIHVENLIANSFDRSEVEELVRQAMK
ncbi:hypothetical protein NCPPB3778_47 [Rathayibacter phage NCPPB3778]|nr:hypothetical protein NCPPB3778_47 [Rathayibacter phage NCPPB3778]